MRRKISKNGIKIRMFDYIPRVDDTGPRISRHLRGQKKLERIGGESGGGKKLDVRKRNENEKGVRGRSG